MATAPIIDTREKYFKPSLEFITTDRPQVVYVIHPTFLTDYGNIETLLAGYGYVRRPFSPTLDEYRLLLDEPTLNRIDNECAEIHEPYKEQKKHEAAKTKEIGQKIKKGFDKFGDFFKLQWQKFVIILVCIFIGIPLLYLLFKWLLGRDGSSSGTTTVTSGNDLPITVNLVSPPPPQPNLVSPPAVIE